MFTEYMSWPEACAATGLDEKELQSKLVRHTRDYDYSTHTRLVPHYQHSRRRNFSVYKNPQILYGATVESLMECPLCAGEDH